MPTIAEIRKKYPQYQDMTDQQLGDALYKKFYSDMPRDQFDAKVGLSSGANGSPDDALGMARTGLGGFIEGIPVAGPLIRRGTEMAAAATIAPFSDKTYSDILSGIDRENAAEKQANPVIDTASQIGGAVAGTVPMIAAAPGAFGAGSGGLVARSLAAGGSGAALGGADAAVRSGGDPGAIARGAGFGAGLGVVAPGLGAVAGKGVNAVTRRFRGPSAAERAIGRAADADAVNADDVASRLGGMGPDAMVMDLGPNLQRQAGALAATPGRGQEVVRSAIAGRDAGANARIGNALDSTLGPETVPSRIEAQIRANQEALGLEYAKVFRNSRAVNTQPIAEKLDSQIVNLRGDAQKAAKRVRGMLNVEGTNVLDPNPRTLFETRQAIDGMLATEADPKVIGMLSEARKLIDNRLSASVPGLKKVDARFAELARQKEGLQRGQKVLDSGRTAPRPSELAAEIDTGATPQGEMIGPSAVPLRLTQGARAEIGRIVGTNANDVVALNRLIKGEGDWNRDRLASLFGPDKAAKIIRILESEKAYANTSRVVTGNSETAARAAAMGEIADNGATAPGIIRSFDISRPGATLATIGDKIMGAAKAAAQGRSNEELARMLTAGAGDAQTITQAIRAVQAAAKRGQIAQDQAQKLVQALVLSGAQDRSRAIPAPAAMPVQ